MKKRFLATILVLCMVLGMMPGTVWATEAGEEKELIEVPADGGGYAPALITIGDNADDELGNKGLISLADSAENISRDTVLVLDNSTSMEGTPLIYLKQAAIKFCDSVFATAGTNRVAVVIYDTNVTTATDFIDNSDELSLSINSMDGEGSWTNITSGVRKAEKLLQSSDATIKNIVVMTDGVPTAGPHSSTGKYSYSDYSGNHNADYYVYEYANVLYETLKSMFEQYNVYTLGFFHNVSNSTKVFASKVLTDSQNSGYYEVTDPAELEFTFGEIADDITQAQMRDLYIKQHLAYYTGTFESEIQEITIPDKNGHTIENTNYLLGNLVLDAATDSASLKYNVAKIITDSLNLDFDFFEGAVSNYDLILADIVTSSYYKDVLKEAYLASAMDDINLLLNGIDKVGSSMLEELAAENNVTLSTLKQEWQTLAQALDQMKITDDPERFAHLFGECSIIVDKYIKADKAQKILDVLGGMDGIKGTVIDAVAGGTFDTISQMVTYYSCYDAYCIASDTFKQVLTMIYFYANSYTTIGSLDQRYYCASLMTSIEKFLENSSENATSAQAVAIRFAGDGLKNFGKSFAESAVDELINHIPIVGKLNIIREIAGITAADTMIVVNCATKIDDQAYASAMVYNLYFLVNCTASAAKTLGNAIETAENLDTKFAAAYRFDEAVRVWRCASLMLCDLGIEFESYRLQSAQKKLNPWIPIISDEAMKDASWYSTAISIAALEKSLISDIHCHDTNLSYDATSGVLDYRENAKVITIACPVTVRVTDSDGNQVALLADDTQIVREGYEPYFHLFETERGVQGDYMKICFVPESWNISFSGTAAGSMHTIRADVVDGEIQDTAVSPVIPIYEGTQGHISNAEDEDIVIIDSVGTTSYTINFDANGGKVIPVTCTTDANGKLTSLPIPTRDGYTFDGWYTAPTGGTYITTNYVFSSNATVYAQWTYTPDATPTPDPSPSPSPWENPFPDVPDTAWYIKAVEYVATEGLMSGYPDGRFGPNNNISRAEFAQIIYNKAGRPGAGASVFTDVKAGQWYANAVTWAVEQKVVAGIGNNRFAPDRDISREELAAILWRYAGSPKPTKTTLDFTDAGKVSAFAKEAMLWANENGIINGKGNGILDPRGKATRAETAQILMGNFKK